MTDSIGSRLRQAREQRRLTLEQVSESTRLRPRYLQALENDDLSAIPSAAQARGFLRIYAAFLELDPSELLHVEAPVAAAMPVEEASPAESVPPKRDGLWASLRQRLTAGGKKAQVGEGPGAAPAGEAAALADAPSDDIKKKTTA